MNTGCRTTDGRWFAIQSFNLLVCILVMSARFCFAQEDLPQRYQKAVDGLGQYVRNMHGRWYAATAVRRYEDAEGRPYAQHRQANLFYSESLLYINAVHSLTSETERRQNAGHFELIVTPSWTISLDHNHVGEEDHLVHVAEGQTRASRLIANGVRSACDITFWFDSRIKQMACHEFAAPQEDDSGRLVVKLNRNSYVSDPDQDRTRNYPVLSLIFGGRSGLRPSQLETFTLDAQNQLSRTSWMKIGYARNQADKPVLQAIQRFDKLHRKMPQFDLRVDEIPPPAWCDHPPRICLGRGRLQVQRYRPSGSRSDQETQLPDGTESLVERLTDEQLQQRLSIQREALRSIREQREQVPLDTVSRHSIASAESGSEDKRSSPSLPLLFICLGLAVPLSWLVLWYRSHSVR